MGAPDDYQRRFGGAAQLFAPGSVFGHRWWAYRPHGGPPLKGMYAPWGAGENHAVCLNRTAYLYSWSGGGVACLGDVQYSTSPGKNHEPPDEDCSCGFYAFWGSHTSPPVVVAQNALAVHVTGVIEGYGATLMGDYGFRCQKARIVGLHVYGLLGFSEELAVGERVVSMMREQVTARLAGFYQVPVYDTAGQLYAAHPVSDPPAV